MRNLENLGKTLEQIQNAGRMFLSPRTLEETYQIIVQEAVRLVGGDDGRILLRKNNKIFTVYQTPGSTFASVRKKGFTYRCFKENKAFVAMANQLTSIHPEVVNEGFKSAIFIPLAYEENVIAVLIVRSIERKVFTKKELQILQLFGSTVSLAIKKMQLYAETKQALETRDLFISLAAHELRTPITSIKIYSELIKKNLPKNTKLFTWSKQLNGDIVRLGNLVNDMLQVEKIKKGKLSYQMLPQNLSEILASAILDVKANYPKHKIIFENSLSKKRSVVCGDFDKLVEVFTNIIGNAAKFSSDNQPITVSLTSSLKSFEIRVVDKGKGISNKDITKIFDKFYRANGNYEGGMGLGLFLTKNIVEEHRGRIYISSKLSVGTTIKITFPKNNTSL